MKVCFIAHRIRTPITGGEFYNDALLKGAERAGFKVEKWEGVFWDRLPIRAFRIVLMNFAYLFKTIFLSKKDILILDTDFHARIILSLMWAHYVSKVKVVGMLHLYYYLMDKGTFRNKIHLLLERFMSSRFDFVIVNSNFSYRSLQELTKKDIPHLILTPYSKEKRDQVSRKVVNDTKELKLIQVGTLEDRKNVVNAIEAVAKLNIPFKLSFVGHSYSEEYTQMLLSLVKQKNLEGKVFFKGQADRKTLEQYYLDSTVFILVSRLESYGMVYAEAMQYGLPIIGSTTGSVPELVTDGENGFLCDPENSVQIANAIERLFNPKEWQRISDTNYKKSRDLMDKETFIEHSSELFKNINPVK
jgi:glycosyltransferase involved in cell wall biosynthesis